MAILVIGCWFLVLGQNTRTPVGIEIAASHPLPETAEAAAHLPGRTPLKWIAAAAGAESLKMAEVADANGDALIIIAHREMTEVVAE